MTDLQELHDHLDATAELPVERGASVRVGEAAAIAADLVDADLPRDVVVERVERVATLLDEVTTTGNEAADEHVRAAERAAERIVSGPAGG
jgi:leucyl aminopeptidase (aminopeptidase T)